MYDERDWPTFCLGWAQTAIRMTLQSYSHPHMMDRVATSTWLVLVFAIEWLVTVTLGFVISWSGTWLVTVGCPVDVAVSMVTVSGGPKELTGVSGRVWLYDQHDILLSPLNPSRVILGESRLPLCKGGWNLANDRNALQLNICWNRYSSNKLQ